MKTHTPKQLETLLQKGFNNATHNAENQRDAKLLFAEVRATYGFKSKGTLLSTDISKLQKNKQATAGLSFPPHLSSGLANLCAFADSCAETCVAFSGNGGFTTTQNSRCAKLKFAILHPEAFAVLLMHELDRMETKYAGHTIAVRLNVYSDLRWELIAPEIFTKFPKINFYDYTKHTVRSRPADTIPRNYSLTYSVSEKTTAEEITNAKTAGRNLAVVVAIRSGKTPTGYRPIPATFLGMKTTDGDIRDDRHNDKQRTVVVLRRKHTMKPWHPMIQNAEVLNGKRLQR
jgi:hypothetical protein